MAEVEMWKFRSEGSKETSEGRRLVFRDSFEGQKGFRSWSTGGTD